MSYSNYKEYLSHPRFLAVRKQVFDRSGGRCEALHDDGMNRCSKPAKDAHHIRYCRWGEFDTPDNLIAVCRACHERLHTCKSCGGYLKAEAIKAGRDVCFDCYVTSQ